MTTRAGYKALFVHADAATLEDIATIRANLKDLPKKPNVSDAVRIALRFTAKKLSEQNSGGGEPASAPVELEIPGEPQ